MDNEVGEGDGALAQPDQGLVDDPGQAVGAGRAGQVRAGLVAAFSGDAAQLLAQGCRAVTRTEARTVRAVLAEATALSRSSISSRRISRSP